MLANELTELKGSCASPPLAIGCAGQALLGREPWSGVPWRFEPQQGGLAMLVGMGTFAVASAFVTAAAALAGAPLASQSFDSWTIVAVLLLAPLLEEWVCRGVLWNALQPYSQPRARVLATAVLFGLLHCLEGLLGFAHRFAAGIAFGWLRERTNSLVPPLLAHATHNAACVAWAAWGS